LSHRWALVKRNDEEDRLSIQFVSYPMKD